MRLYRSDLLALIYTGVTAALVYIHGFTFWAIGPSSLLFLAIVLDGIFRPASPWFMPVVARGRPRGHMVALTFDDGPDPNVTPKILDMLKGHKVKATFFVIGQRVEQYPELARRIVEEGHEIGNHTHTHPRLFNLKLTRGMQREIERAAATIQQVTGVRPALFRPPVGLKNPHLAIVSRRLGLRVVMWSLHARDTLFRDHRRVSQRVLKRIRSGDIVDLHDGHDLAGGKRPHTARAVASILARLEWRGIKCVTVSELLSS